MRKSKMLKCATGAAMLLAVSWWFDPGYAQLGPFSSSAACVKVAEAIGGQSGNICYSNTGLVVSVP